MSLKTLFYRFTASQLWVQSKLGKDEARNAVALVMVHGVHEPQTASRLRPPSSSTSMLAFQTNVLSVRRNYTFINMDDALAMLSGQAAWRNRCVVLTFDDSLKCLAERIAPQLAQWGVPATFYVSTETIETRQPYWWLRLDYALARTNGRVMAVELPDGRELILAPRESPESVRELKAVLRGASAADCDRVVGSVETQIGTSLVQERRAYPFADTMTWEDVRRLQELGMTVGSHTVSHPNLALLGGEELHRELAVSRRAIQEKTQVECRHLAYPYGAHSETVCRVARDVGYASAVTTSAPGWNRCGDDLYRLKRFPMPGHAYQLPYAISGMATRLQRFRRRH